MAYDGPMLRITDKIALEDWELTEQFVRASGPGGQNVNKVSTAVELRFEAERSPALTPPVKARLRRLAGRRWTQEGALVLFCDKTRCRSNRSHAPNAAATSNTSAVRRSCFPVSTRWP